MKWIIRAEAPPRCRANNVIKLRKNGVDFVE